MSGAELKAIRTQLGLTQWELGQWLKLEAQNPGNTVRTWEVGRSSISGPVIVCLEAFVSGFRPAHISTTN